MKFKNKASATDFLESSLPVTRKQQFFDILKNEFHLLLKIGAMLALFALPFAIMVSFKMVGLQNLISGLIEAGASEMEIQQAYLQTAMVLDLIETITLMIFSLGISGACRVYRELCWSNGVFFMKDFFRGIKKYWLKPFILFGILGLMVFAKDLLVNLAYYYSSDGMFSSIADGALLGLLGFVIMPFILLLIASNTIYNNPLAKEIKNVGVMVTLNYIPYVFFSLAIAATLFVQYIPIVILVPVSILVLVIVALPIFMLAHHLYALSVFDRMINANYEDYQFKGLYHVKEGTL